MATRRREHVDAVVDEMTMDLNAFLGRIRMNQLRRTRLVNEFARRDNRVAQLERQLAELGTVVKEAEQREEQLNQQLRESQECRTALENELGALREELATSSSMKYYDSYVLCQLRTYTNNEPIESFIRYFKFQTQLSQMSEEFLLGRLKCLLPSHMAYAIDKCSTLNGAYDELVKLYGKTERQLKAEFEELAPEKEEPIKTFASRLLLSFELAFPSANEEMREIMCRRKLLKFAPKEAIFYEPLVKSFDELVDFISCIQEISTSTELLQSKRSNKQSTRSIICYNCGEPGHIKSQCAKQHQKRNKKPPKSQGTKFVSTSSVRMIGTEEDANGFVRWSQCQFRLTK